MASGKNLTGNQKRAIMSMDRRNLFPSVIAQKVGISPATVRRVIKNKRK